MDVRLLNTKSDVKGFLVWLKQEKGEPISVESKVDAMIVKDKEFLENIPEKTHSLLLASRLLLLSSSRVMLFDDSQSFFSCSKAFLRSSNSRI